MTLQKLTNLLSLFDTLSYAYGDLPENVEPPYISYHAEEENAIFADGKKVYADEVIILNLITKKRDLRLEAEIDAMFCRTETQATKQYQFDSNQNIHIVTYSFTAET